MSVMSAATKTVLSLSVFFSVAVEAKSLACWNAYSRFGSKPVLTARIVKNDKLRSVKVSEVAYKSQSVNPSMNRLIAGKPVASSNMYKGNREFDLSQGARLILPMELSQQSLNRAAINKIMNKKSNGVLILPFANETKKTKDYTFLPMMCQEII